MGVLYLIDAHTPVLLDSEINDTIPVESGDTQVTNGSFPVSVPFGVPIDGVPANLTELLTKKFAGLLAFFPGYTYIDYDEGIDGSGWDASNSKQVAIGDRGNTFLYNGPAPSESYLTSNALALTGPAPSEAIVTWELYEFTRSNDKGSALTRSYAELDPSEVTCNVSFDGGSNFVNNVTDGVQFSIPLASQGTSFVMYLESNSTTRRFWVGGWAVIY